MQAMGQHMDFAVCPGHHVPVHPDKPVALVECHTHFRPAPQSARYFCRRFFVSVIDLSAKRIYVNKADIFSCNR